jgi:hypothetical protein
VPALLCSKPFNGNKQIENMSTVCQQYKLVKEQSISVPKTSVKINEYVQSLSNK